MQAIDGIFYVVILIMSVVVHEFAHGYTAYLLGDNTARIQGRLTLNPLKHLDIFGSVLLPLLLVISKAGFVIGWARPVPYNPNNLRNGRNGNIMVSVAGILANLFIAILFGLMIRFATQLGLPPYTSLPIHPFYKITSIIVLTNLVLALFNIIPIPPLDGSRVIVALLPSRFQQVERFLDSYGFVILIAVMLILNIFGIDILSTPVRVLFRLLTGSMI